MANVVWTPEMEVSLFYAMIDHKPVGENKHFHMIFIYEKFNDLSEKKLSIEQIWQHLNTLYDMKALDENDIVPFPNDETDFCLPDFENTNLNISDDSEASLKTCSSSSKTEPIKPKKAMSTTSSTSNRNTIGTLNTSTTTTTTTTTTFTNTPKTGPKKNR